MGSLTDGSDQRVFERLRILALAQLASRLAHDFNNDLTVMSGNVQLLQRDGGASLAPRLETLQTTTSRAQRRVRLVLDLQAGPTCYESVEAAELCADLEALLELLIPRGRSVKRDLAPLSGVLRIDRCAWLAACAGLVSEALTATTTTPALQLRAGPSGGLELRLTLGERLQRLAPYAACSADRALLLICHDDGVQQGYRLDATAPPASTNALD